MPSTCCSVPGCHNRGGHQFPTQKERCKAWIVAIRRVKNKQGHSWLPTQSSVVCTAHFKASDYQKQTTFDPSLPQILSCPKHNPGTQLQRKKLLLTAVPSIFPWAANSSPEDERGRRADIRASKKGRIPSNRLSPPSQETNVIQQDYTEYIFSNDEIMDAYEEVSTEPSFTNTLCQTDSVMTTTTSTQTLETQPAVTKRWCLEDFSDDPEAIQYYTGLSDINIVKAALASLGPAAHCLNYINGYRPSLPVATQFFLTLIKLRLYRTNFELSKMFVICETDVNNIFVTWIRFMSQQWHEIDIWPSRDLVKFFSPTDFKAKFPTTRVIVDGTEIPVKKPSAPAAQQVTFSTYKNRNTAKVLIGVTPGGQVSYVSPAYGGSTSDRQIVERGNLTRLCDPKDSVMADKGFDVQDLFAPYDVTINIPAFFKKQNRISGATVLKDRKIASKRVHVERLIGLGKTYKILCNPLNHTESLLASDIIYVCYMLVNFKPCIVPKNA